MRNRWDPFVVIIAASVALHGGLGIYAWMRPPEETLPEPLPMVPGRVSIAFQEMSPDEPALLELDKVDIRMPEPPAPKLIELPPPPPLLPLQARLPVLPSFRPPVDLTPPEPPPPPESPRPAKEEPRPDMGPKSTINTRESEGADVDQMPSLRYNPSPPYPGDLLAAGVEGRVILTVHVGANGRALAVKVYQSSGHPALDESALATVRDHWQFHPARKGNLAVAKEVNVPVSFRVSVIRR